MTVREEFALRFAAEGYRVVFEKLERMSVEDATNVNWNKVQKHVVVAAVMTADLLIDELQKPKSPP